MDLPESAMPCMSYKTETPRLNTREGGFMLVSMTIIIIIIVALISSFTFVTTRERRFNVNFSTGERLAQLAVMAHPYAQTAFYRNGIDLDSAGNLFVPGGLVPPDNFRFSPALGTNFSVEVVGRNLVPINSTTPAAIKAPSAYIHLRIRTSNGAPRNPTDTVALISGANKRGMGRLGIVGIGFPVGDMCDSSSTMVRWGPESSSCLNSAQVGSLFTNVQTGDIIVPAWETALAKMSMDAMYRYKQPERPDMNAMLAPLKMNNNAILEATTTNVNDITATGTTQMQDMTIRQGSTTTFANQLVTNNTLRVYNQGSPANGMTVNGAVNFTGSNINISQGLQRGAGSLSVHSATPVGTQSITSPGALAVAPVPGNPLADIAVNTVAGNLTNFATTGANTRMIIAGNLNTTGALISSGTKPLDIYSAQLTTTGATQIQNATNNLPWTVGTIDQKAGGQLRLKSLTVSDCQGNACPDSVITPPSNGGF